MFKKLESVEKKYDELTEILSQQEVVANRPLYQKTAREHSSLAELVTVYRYYKKIVKEFEENKHILDNEKDAELKKMAKEEMTRLEDEVTKTEQQLKVLLLPKDPNDDKSVILEIRAGTGGEEAALFASDLYRMYSRYAETKRWKVEIMDSNPTGIGGFKEIIATISGNKVYSDLKYESGVHRVQRVPKTEASGRIHTSAVTVAVMPEADDVDVIINEKDIEVDVFRASGPGGQGVNTTDSAVRITHKPSGMVVVCREERSQLKNKATALKLLRSRLLEQKIEEQDAQERATRKSYIGTGDRSEKIRTYNFPQNRITDHRIGLTIHQLDQVLEGKLEEFVTSLRTHYQAETMKGS
ncbi:MAG: peptide chain release factor 1 [Deltaproteobacteria bacterium CG11_big_fil_rev_8_21_14_0_20_49_13]|nr:MAG: peptide chain release factor 1 [Deltaproteobacteria bacterium CG11_big_fil_rev_8_21_14_0_20_49_13]